MKTENEFITQLEEKAREQQKLVRTEILPSWAKGVGGWLVVNPWRVLVPLSGLGYLFLRGAGGVWMRESVLALFGGFR